VNRLFHAAALPYLYADVAIGLPSSFEAFLSTVGVLQPDEDISNIDDDNDRPGRQRRLSSHHPLLTPPDSRETSRDRGRRSSTRSYTVSSQFNANSLDCPPTDFFMPVSPTDASSRSAGASTQFATPWRIDNPGMYMHSLTFEKFRSHGLRRTVKESSRQRFVTSERILQILRGTRGPGSLLEGQEEEGAGSNLPLITGHLSALGLTEYIDVGDVCTLTLVTCVVC
jgi:hypothetical protein